MEELETLYVVSYVENDDTEGNNEFGNYSDALDWFNHLSLTSFQHDLKSIALYRIDTNWDDFEDHTLLKDEEF